MNFEDGQASTPSKSFNASTVDVARSALLNKQTPTRSYSNTNDHQRLMQPSPSSKAAVNMLLELHSFLSSKSEGGPHNPSTSATLPALPHVSSRSSIDTTISPPEITSEKFRQDMLPVSSTSFAVPVIPANSRSHHKEMGCNEMIFESMPPFQQDQLLMQHFEPFLSQSTSSSSGSSRPESYLSSLKPEVQRTDAKKEGIPHTLGQDNETGHQLPTRRSLTLSEPFIRDSNSTEQNRTGGSNALLRVGPSVTPAVLRPFSSLAPRDTVVNINDPARTGPRMPAISSSSPAIFHNVHPGIVHVPRTQTPSFPLGFSSTSQRIDSDLNNNTNNNSNNLLMNGTPNSSSGLSNQDHAQNFSMNNFSPSIPTQGSSQIFSFVIKKQNPRPFPKFLSRVYSI